MPGESPSYTPLMVSFLMDERFQTYKTILDWLGIFSQDPQPWNLLTKDIKLHMLSANKNILVTFTFYDAFPVSLPEVSLESNVAEPIPLTFNIEFRYSYFTLE